MSYRNPFNNCFPYCKASGHLPTSIAASNAASNVLINHTFKGCKNSSCFLSNTLQTSKSAKLI